MPAPVVRLTALACSRLVVWLALSGGLLGAPEGFTNSVGPRLIPIAPGEFSMGQDARQATFRSPWSAAKDRGADWDESPTHVVRITQAFFLGETEVTNAQYEQFDAAHRTRRTKASLADVAAVVQVSWHDAVRFCAWLSAREGRPHRDARKEG